MFRTVFPSIIRSLRLYIQQQTCLLLYVQSWTPDDGREDRPKHVECHSKTKLLQTAISFWHMSVAVCTVLNSWWWTERPSETCRVSFQNTIIDKLVYLVGFTIEIKILSCDRWSVLLVTQGCTKQSIALVLAEIPTKNVHLLRVFCTMNIECLRFFHWICRDKFVCVVGDSANCHRCLKRILLCLQFNYV